MFAGTLTKNIESAANAYSGIIHSSRFDIAIGLETRAKLGLACSRSSRWSRPAP
jgi:hypothetical protein